MKVVCDIWHEVLHRMSARCAGRLQVSQQPDCFFFSSRRRHTRLQGDWSSDVCSSDLQGTETLFGLLKIGVLRGYIEESETLELTEEPLVSPEMRNEMGRCFKAGIHVDRKSTRLNSSHLVISYAVFCLKKNKLPLLIHAIKLRYGCYAQWRSTPSRRILGILGADARRRRDGS